MAKPTKSQEAEGEITFTIVKFGLKGSDSTLQKSVDALKMALAQAGIGTAQETRQLRAPSARQLTNGSDQGGESEVLDVEETTDDAAEETAETTAPARSSTPRTKPKAKNYTAVPDVGFNSVTPSFKDFATGKNPGTDSKKLLVIAYWFKHHLQQPNVTAELVYTAFREMKWTVPTDIGATIRELRSTRDQRLMKGSEANTSAISNIGENTVDELGKAES